LPPEWFCLDDLLRQLRKLVGLDESGAIPSGYDPVTGRVISRSPTSWSSDVIVDAGSGDGVTVNDPVINGDGLVGKVTAVTSSSAKVVPGGIQGSIRPAIGDPADLILDFIDSTKRVHEGEAVVTAGWRSQTIESRFPPNIPIGEVTEAPIEEQEAQQQVHVKPYADLRNLDFVQVLTGGSR